MKLWQFCSCLVLVIPLFSFVTAKGVKVSLNNELRSASQKKFLDVGIQPGIGNVSLDRFCQDWPRSFPEICSKNKNLTLLSATSVGAACFGLFFLLAIGVAGFLARGNQRILFWVFKIGLYLTTILTIGLVIVHAGLIITAFYFINRGLILIGVVIGLGALYGVVRIARNVFLLIRTVSITLVGKVLSSNESPRLWNNIKKIADQLNALPPENVIVGINPSFFVTESDVILDNEECSGRTLYCSLPLMRVLNTKEFDGVIGHELGHFKGFDSEYTQRFYPVYQGAIDTYDALSANLRKEGEELPYFALLPALGLFRFFLDSLSVAERQVSRKREIIADKVGVLASDKYSFGSALVKFHVYSNLWTKFIEDAEEDLRKSESKVFHNLSKTFSELIAENSKPDILEGIADSTISHPADTHPPLGIRLDSLEISVTDIESDALNIRPASPAIDLIDQTEKLEEELTCAMQTFLTRQAAQNEVE